MNIFNYRNKKKKEEQERVEKLSVLRSLWMDYKVHYYQYDIQYRCPITGKVKTYKFHYKIDRKAQKDSNNPADQASAFIAMKKGQEFLHEDVAYHNGHGEGIVIHQPLQVKFHEISKKEYDKVCG